MPSVLVRPVRAGEYERAGAVVVAAYRALPGEHMSAGYAAELADVARRAGEAEVLVAVAVAGAGGGRGAGDAGEAGVSGETGGILGCVTFVPDASSPWAELVQPDEAAIRMLGVDPGAQGRGVGQALLDACLERARQLGRAAVFLHSTPWMTTAHRLYEQAGFVRVPERDWRPVPTVPLLAFRLALARSTRPSGLSGSSQSKA